MAIKLVECPRDAMQGWSHQIPTEVKVGYINQLLKVGFDVLDMGSFVSPKAIPQMADTKEVLQQIDLSNTSTELLTIIANERGAADAVAFDQVTYLGFPFSISETFQKLNTNSSIEESLHRVEAIQNLCVNHSKKMVAYISMGFGNPYGDAYDASIVSHWIERLSQLGISIFSLADTVGVAKPDNIAYLYKNLIPDFYNVEIGAHFHTTPTTWEEKIQAAYDNGCVMYDGAIRGIGGCPMAQEELVGNMDTINLLSFFTDKKINQEAFDKSVMMSNGVFV